MLTRDFQFMFIILIKADPLHLSYSFTYHSHFDVLHFLAGFGYFLFLLFQCQFSTVMHIAIVSELFKLSLHMSQR